jgi:hypothetical protein
MKKIKKEKNKEKNEEDKELDKMIEAGENIIKESGVILFDKSKYIHGFGNLEGIKEEVFVRGMFNSSEYRHNTFVVNIQNKENYYNLAAWTVNKENENEREFDYILGSKEEHIKLNNLDEIKNYYKKAREGCENEIKKWEKDYREKVEVMKCVKYDCVYEENLYSLLKGKFEIKKEENLSDYFKNSANEEYEKLSYVNKKGEKIFVLQREVYMPPDGSACDIWHFKKDFNKESAKEFIKQFDKEFDKNHNLKKQEKELGR